MSPSIFLFSQQFFLFSKQIQTFLHQFNTEADPGVFPGPAFLLYLLIISQGFIKRFSIDKLFRGRLKGSNVRSFPLNPSHQRKLHASQAFHKLPGIHLFSSGELSFLQLPSPG